MKKIEILIVIFLVIIFNSCTKMSKKMQVLKIDKIQFGETMDGTGVDQFILSNNN